MQTERRSYFRINDIIGLSYSVLEDGEKFSPESTVGLAGKLASFDARFNQIENALWQENPVVAQALGVLNMKISTIASHYTEPTGNPIDSYDEMEVSISGCGMAFNCLEALPVQTRLRVGVVLKPSNIDLTFSATVMACEPALANTAGAYWMRIEIDEENHAAREQLIQHVVQKQSISINKSR